MRSGSRACCLGALGGPAAAQADTGDIIAPQNNPPNANDGWQAGTCTRRPNLLARDARSQFFTQAAGHPPFGFTQFIVKHNDRSDPRRTGRRPQGRPGRPAGRAQRQPAGDARSASWRPSDERRRAARRARSSGSASSPPRWPGVVAAAGHAPGLQPRPQPGRTGAVRLRAPLGSERLPQSRRRLERRLPRGLHDRRARSRRPAEILKNRLVFTGVAGNGTFLTTPSTCLDPAQAAFAHTYSTFLRADSVEVPDPDLPQRLDPLRGAAAAGRQADRLRAGPVQTPIAVDPGHQPDRLARRRRRSRSKVPFEPRAADRQLQRAGRRGVTLPLGHGPQPLRRRRPRRLHRRPVRQGHQRTRSPARPPRRSAPSRSRPRRCRAGSLTGNVFLGKQLSRDPTSGDEYRIFVDAESARYGVSVRLIGNVSADPKTGQLTDDLRRQPAGPVHLLQAPVRRRPQGGADQPADLRPERRRRSR